MFSSINFSRQQGPYPGMMSGDNFMAKITHRLFHESLDLAASFPCTCRPVECQVWTCLCRFCMSLWVCVCVMMSKPRHEVRFWMEAELRVDVVWLVWYYSSCMARSLAEVPQPRYVLESEGDGDKAKLYLSHDVRWSLHCQNWTETLFWIAGPHDWATSQMTLTWDICVWCGTGMPVRRV